jgi:hypothetical protein
MLKDGIGGVIINIPSTPAIAEHVQGAPYTLALGNIATEGTFNSMSQENRKKVSEETSMKRWEKPEEVAKVAVRIASCNFSFRTGNTIVIDGGRVLL